MRQDEYTIRLDSFQGPLDLLLYLIKKAEVDITDIPIASITDQYLALLQGLERIDVEEGGDFLILAATLMEIKSRLIAPPMLIDGNADTNTGKSVHAEISLDQSDPRYDLVMQLLDYKRFRDAAQDLEERSEKWALRYPVGAIHPNKTAQSQSSDDDNSDSMIETDMDDLSMWDLVETFQRIIEAVDFGKLGDHQIDYDDTPIELHAEDLVDQLKRSNSQISLRSAFTGRTRSEAVGLFLATLELIRQGRVTAQQDRIHDDIVLLLVVGSDQDEVGDHSGTQVKDGLQNEDETNRDPQD